MDIQVTGLRKHFVSEGNIIKALDDVSIRIPADSIFTLLGPSGCGKTTLLRCIVGLETPDAGEIRIGDKIVWSAEKNIYLPTEKRGLGMVFQTYAIWPHMNVFNNVAYPLQVRKLPKKEIRERVAKTLSFVQLEGFEDRPATKLSGGQQQRVALARALVAEPEVILFDEPLSNLDAKLREETRKELKSFLSELKITAIYVTHDRIEALALSDTIAVMRSGKIIETGNPRKIYFGAESSFVADFIGRSNLIPATVTTGTAKETAVESKIGKFLCGKTGFTPGTKVTLCLRPEFIRPRHATPSEVSILEQADAPAALTLAAASAEALAFASASADLAGAGAPMMFSSAMPLSAAKAAKSAPNHVQGTVETLLFVGDSYESEIRVGETLLMARFDPDSDFKVGDKVAFQVASEHCLLVAK